MQEPRSPGEDKPVPGTWAWDDFTPPWVRYPILSSPQGHQVGIAVLELQVGSTGAVRPDHG